MRRTFTYAELAQLVDSIAAKTCAAVEGRSGPVAVLLGHEARFPAAMFGVLAARCGFVPIDAAGPIERIRTIADDSGAIALVTSTESAALGRRLVAGDAPVILVEDCDAAPKGEPPNGPGPDDLAWILYTSGSTGMPKGVYQNHRGLFHDSTQAITTLAIEAGHRIAMFNLLTVVSGLRLCTSALLSGASLHVLSPVELKAHGLVEQIRMRQITDIRCVPALFRRIADALPVNERLHSVRSVFLGGDRVEWSDFDLFQRCCPPEADFGVLIGGTECSSIHTQWIVDPGLREPNAPLPLGRSLADWPVTVVDDNGDPIPDGETGELMVASRYLALGYWRSPELSARAFGIHPGDASVRTFRTGDLGVRRTDGLLEYRGRKDSQIKIGGHRIEPGEVESALRRCSGIGDAAIVVRKDENGVPKSMVAYVELAPGTRGLQPRHILSMASQVLPRAMVPATAFIEAQLPRLSNLKLDRPAIVALDASRAVDPSGRLDDPTIDFVARIFESALGVTGATANDSVASLGGDSLQAVGVLTELRHRLGMEIPDEIFESSRSIRELADWIVATKVEH